jgi:UDP-glucose 6-dehydrogenase
MLVEDLGGYRSAEPLSITITHTRINNDGGALLARSMDASRDHSIIIVGAGSCGRAIATLIRDVMGTSYYYYDIDPSRSLDGGKRAGDLGGFDIYHICVPEDRVEDLVSKIPTGSSVIIHSTMPVGGMRRLGRGDLVYMPMFFREMHIEKDIRSPGRIVIGTSSGSCPQGYVLSLTTRWAIKYGAKIYCLSYEEAEIVKLGTNALRALAISFYNEIYYISKKYGADHNKIFDILSPTEILDNLEGGRWGRRKELAGKPFDGKCLPKDLDHIASASTLRSSIFRAIKSLNREIREIGLDNH